jgi:3-methylcrotonyl-CoA carboxylase alpha subunit
MKRLLIANRGEIAVRIARAARELGISPVGVYSDADVHALHREVMDASINIGPAPATESYLQGERIIAAAKTLGADAIHPGYGFLSERASFAQAVADAGLIFVGPSPAAIGQMGSKIEAKQRVRERGVPVVPGYDGEDRSLERLRTEAGRIDLPLLIKASAGGGGRGMRVVHDLAQFEDALASAMREAKASFGDDAMLLERYLRRPRHIEVQILADQHGTTLALGERECSIQRRHQKVLEEAPSVALDARLREQMFAAAIAAAESVGYTNAGTVEFMLDEDGSFYFLEVNARLQVEHPVTELVYGVDLVHWQLRIAQGERLTIGSVEPRGWSIEVRLNAEDPARDFLPSTGTLTAFSVPNAPGVRVDTGFRAGSEVSVYYDSLLAKIIVWGADRSAAIARMQATLASTEVGGVTTNLGMLRAIVADPAYITGDTTTRFLEERPILADLLAAQPAEVLDAARHAAATLAASGRAWRMGSVGMPVRFTIGGKIVATNVTLIGDDFVLSGDLAGTIARRDLPTNARIDPLGIGVDLRGRAYRFAFAAGPSADAEHAAATGSGTVTAPMPGKITSVSVRKGDRVEARTLLVVLEAMKMEHRIEAPLAGNVGEVFVEPGQLVAAGATLVKLHE